MIADRQQTATDLLEEKNLLPQMLLEDYLSVALGVRKCSLTTIPAEFPDGKDIARRIDLACISDYHKLALERDVKKKAKLIQKFKNTLREAYQVTVERSPSFRCHANWTNRLALRVFEVEVRPTVRELFFHMGEDTKTRLQELYAIRASFRDKFLRDLREQPPRSAFAYPEEYSSDYVLGMGELLGYPRCCIEAYLRGRTMGNVLAEERASKQIQVLRAQGLEPELYAFFAKDFIPCTATCGNAAATGRKFLGAFEQFDIRLCQPYMQSLKTNLANVEFYVQRIESHKEKMKAQAQELGIKTLR